MTGQYEKVTVRPRWKRVTPKRLSSARIRIEAVAWVMLR